MNRDDLNPKILGQLLLMQSVVINLPDNKSIFSFVKQGLSEIPGVSNVIIATEKTAEEFKIESFFYFPIVQNNTFYGELIFEIKNVPLFSTYIEYLSNFAFMLAVILEERKQRQIIENHQKELEEKINERTRELQIEKENLFESQRRYSDLMSNVTLLTIMLDEKGNIIFCNNYLLQSTGYTYDEIINRNWFDIFLKNESKDQVYQIYKDIINGHPVISNYENEIITKNGDVLIVSWNNTTLYDNNRNIIGTASIGQDITKRKQDELLIKEKTEEIEAQNEEYIQINEELVKAKNKAEESDRLKTAFLQNMSHEIRTPMNAIMGFSGLLVNNFNNKQKLEQFAKIIEQRCNDLLEIINDLLDISKIEAGQSSVNIEPCNVNELLSELCIYFNDYQSRNNKRHIQLSMHQIANDSVVRIQTDKVKLKQILINLITNAFKYTEQGIIECGYKLENNKLQFYVSDTGIGIPRDKFGFIFERFAQIKHPLLNNVGGTGLGLSIVKGMVELLGGTVWLESECNKGTTFFFTIDYIKNEFSDQNHIDIGSNIQNVISDKTILIVEDDQYNALYLQEILTNSVSKIYIVDSGIEAIKFVQNHLVDIILMDISLPDISGYEATRTILQNHPKVKIIAQTAYASYDEPQKAFNAGCIDYISKPTKQERLLLLLKKYL